MNVEEILKVVIGRLENIFYEEHLVFDIKADKKGLYITCNRKCISPSYNADFLKFIDQGGIILEDEMTDFSAFEVNTNILNKYGRAIPIHYKSFYQTPT